MKTKILTVALILGLISCKKVDEEKPVISIETPANNQHFEPGNTIDLKGKITDNEALSQVKIDMHSGDGHIHKSTKSIFDFEEIIDIEGKEYALSLPINIPVDADTGLYHLIIEVTDAEGNEAEFIELDLEIHEH